MNRDVLLSRRDLLRATASALPLAYAGFAFPRIGDRRPAEGLRLQPLPSRLYKLVDPSAERAESWVFWLLVEADRHRALDISSLHISYRSQGREVLSTDLTRAALTAVTMHPPATAQAIDGRSLATPTERPLAIRIRCTAPTAASVDAIDVTLRVAESGSVLELRASYPVETFAQKSLLVFPFRGNGLVTKAGVLNGGHANRSGQFAVDVIGLSHAYAIYKGSSTTRSDDYAAWGREIIAPAAGEVVTVRADRPDQPNPDKSDPRFYAPEFPTAGDPGNHVVVRHGSGEFSMLAHMQAGSVLVRTGDRVTQGQTIGKLGSSGDTVTPHVHYQLQSGPDWQFSDGLPASFSNVGSAVLSRGTFLTGM